jgi:uncharacterized protein YjbI with pentapeptide repeats
VGHTIIRVITAHLQADMAEAKSWRGLNFDFTGVVFDGGAIMTAKFYGGMVDFTGAVFSDGLVNFRRARFSGAVSFERAVFSGGTVDFSGAVFSNANVSFSGARFSGADVRFFIDSLIDSGVDFREVGDWSSPPGFPWGDTDMPPMVKVPSSREDQSQT